MNENWFRHLERGGIDRGEEGYTYCGRDLYHYEPTEFDARHPCAVCLLGRQMEREGVRP